MQFRLLYFVVILFFSFSFSDKDFFSLKSRTDNHIIVEFDLKDYTVQNIMGKDQVTLGEEEEAFFENPKKFSTFIQLINNENYSIDIDISSDQNYSFENGDSYQNNNPLDLRYTTKEHIFRGVKLLEITIEPFSINKNEYILNVIERTSIHVNLERANIVDDIRYSETFLNLINDFSINPIDIESRDLEFQDPSILYISDPDIMTNPYLQALINWRKQQGYDVSLVSTNDTGNSSASIQNYIEDVYYSSSNPPEYLCLVGDADGSVSVPAFVVSGGAGTGGAQGESDYPYTLIEGDDLYPEMLVGRISVRNSTELATVVNKIIGYEKAYAGIDGWLSTAALVGDPYDSGISTVITNQYIEQIMNNYGVENVNTQYSGSNFDTFMRDQINSGISYLNYRGFYGFSNFNHSDVNLLNNGYRLPFISTLTCGVNNFSSDNESIVEALLRSGTVANPSGAVAVVGTSESYTHTAFNNIVSMGIFEGIYIHEAQTTGSALLYGKLALINAYPQNPNNNVELFSSWNNLMGDPLTHLWTNTPINLIANHEPFISSNSDFFTVTLSDEEGRPINNALITLYKDDEHSINSSTDEFGRAHFNLNYEYIGNVLVTSRCHNCVPEETSFEITDDFPNVSIIENSTIIYDFLEGNSDGYANPGETVSISFDIQNQSEDMLADCSLEVLSHYSEIQFINNVFDINSIDSNDIVNVQGISFFVNNVASQENNIFPLEVHLSCEEISWNFTLPIQINYGIIEIDLELLSDQNNNMILDPGETGQFSISFNNNGYIDLYDLDVSFNYDDSVIQIQNNNSSMNVLELSSNGEYGEVSIIASNNIINGSIINIPININSSNGYEASIINSIQIGNISSVDPLGPDEYGYYIYGDEDISYQWAPNYEWIEIDPDYGGDGIELSIYDGGNNQDDSEVFDLPFTFTFYGEDYNQITICSNGWIALGATDMTSFRNYNLPGTGGPSPMIAVFWDDLKTTNGGEMYWYHDSINDYLVIEWSNVRTYTDNDVETFQAILYDSGDFTPTGDDEIKLQYKEFNNTSEGYYPVGNYNGAVVHGQYSTIGIENLYGTVGLEYTFNDEYPMAADPLSDESALFITTRNPQVFSQPSLNVSDNAFNLNLNPNEEEDFILTITNDGQEGSILDYDISLSPFGDIILDVDEGGYAWLSSLSSDEILYDWEDVSEEANLLSFEHNDYAEGPLPIGFSFPFYGENYDELIVSPNGWVGFGEDNYGWNNQAVFSEDSPNNAIFAFWDDLNPESSLDNAVGSGNVYIDSNSERCIIWYDHVSHWTSLNRIYDFQLILYPDGSISINYREMLEDTDSATIGIVNQTGEIGQQVVYNDDFIEDELSIRFKGSPTWIDYYQVTGEDTSLEYNESNFYSININSHNLPQGNYSASLIIDPEGLFYQTVPINLTILEFDIILGDSNFDGLINVLDIVNIMGFIIESSVPTPLEAEASDINQDNFLDVLDVVTIVNIILSE